MTKPQADVARLAAQWSDGLPPEVVAGALELFGRDVAISFSGAEDVLLIEYAHQWASAEDGRTYRVFSLDTGRLHPETYRLFDEVEKHYGIRIEYCFPEAMAVEQLVRRMMYHQRLMRRFLSRSNQERNHLQRFMQHRDLRSPGERATCKAARRQKVIAP